MEKIIKISDKVILWLSKDRTRTKAKLAVELGISRPTLDNIIKDNSWQPEFVHKLDELGIM